MLAIGARSLLKGTAIPTPQPLEEGRQYYRLHPDVLALANRQLAGRLRAYNSHPWSL
jgi:hypothetical protein